MEEKYRRAADVVICVAGAVAAIYLIFKYALGAILPFLLAYIFALIISPLAQKISKKSGASEKFISGFLVIFIFLIISLLVGVAVNRLLSELGRLIERFSESPEVFGGVLNKISQKISAIGNHSGSLAGIAQGLDRLTASAAESAIEFLSAKIPSLAVSAVSSIPDVLLFTVSFLLSCFYLCVDRERINSFLLSLLPIKAREILPSVRTRASAAISSYLRAYLLIMLITFTEVFIGLTIIGIDYAFIIAIVIAAVDILPVLGAGAALVPWAIYCFIVSDVFKGMGLLILFAVITVIRQIIEPRIVGKSIGLHPVAMLLSVYAGLKFFGFGGIIIGPAAAIIIKGLIFFGRGEEENRDCNSTANSDP